MSRFAWESVIGRRPASRPSGAGLAEKATGYAKFEVSMLLAAKKLKEARGAVPASSVKTGQFLQMQE
ncbi:MAG TPA: hypothetical protein VIP27_04650 [Variovorax sp.]